MSCWGIASFLFVTLSARTFHISETRCSNSCVVVYGSSTGTTTIKDCCGGTVRVVSFLTKVRNIPAEIKLPLTRAYSQPSYLLIYSEK